MSSSENPTVRFGDWISEGWKMFTEQWGTWVLLSLGALIVTALPMLAFTAVIIVFVFANAAQSAAYNRSQPPDAFFFLLFLGIPLLMLVVLPLSAYFQGGVYKAAFKQLRGGRIEFRDLFSGGDVFLPLLGEIILIGILTFIGGMLCVIPGLIVGGLLMFSVPLTIERRLGVIDAMRTSFEMTKGHLVLFTLFALLLQLIVGAGSYVCYVGILATYPLQFTMTAVAYRDCFGLAGARSFVPPQGPPVSPYSAPTPPPQQVEGSVCPVCQAALPSTATFCFRCGARVGS